LNVETLAGSSALRCKHFFLFERTQKHMDAMYARCPRIGLHYSSSRLLTRTTIFHINGVDKSATRHFTVNRKNDICHDTDSARSQPLTAVDYSRTARGFKNVQNVTDNGATNNRIG